MQRPSVDAPICPTKETCLPIGLRLPRRTAIVDAAKQSAGKDRKVVQTSTDRTKAARLKCDAARNAFEDHCSEHGCILQLASVE